MKLIDVKSFSLYRVCIDVPVIKDVTQELLDEEGEFPFYMGAVTLTSKDGKRKYMAGTLGCANVLIFKNDYKRPDSKDPDYNLFISKKEKKEQQNENYVEEIDF